MEEQHTTEENLFFIMGRLEGKVDVLIASRDGHENRITAIEAAQKSLELSRAKFIGMAVAASGAVSFVTYLLTNFVLRHA